LTKLINWDYFNVMHFVHPVIAQLDDLEETVRFSAFKILSTLAGRSEHLINENCEQMLKKLSAIFDKSKAKRDDIIREKGRQYQCLEMLIG
jgi:hypothetical protein